MDEDELYEILGVTPPDSTGTSAGDEEEQNPAAASDSIADSESEIVPDSDTMDDETTKDDGQGGSPEEPSPGPDKPADQEPRWQAVAQQMIAQAVAEERAKNQAEWNAFFAAASLKNSLDNGKPITNLEEFRQWKAAYDRAKLEQDLKEGRLTPEMLESMIAQKIADRPATGDKQTMQAVHERSQAPEVTQEQINAELAEIHRLDNSVNGLEDILKMDTSTAFQDAVRRGHSFLDAFKLANFDRLQSQKQNEAAQRAAQAVRNNARSKEHLRPSVSKGGSASVAVPGDVMEMYKMMMPDASEEDITAHYNRMLKETKK